MGSIFCLAPAKMGINFCPMHLFVKSSNLGPPPHPFVFCTQGRQPALSCRIPTAILPLTGINPPARR